MEALGYTLVYTHTIRLHTAALSVRRIWLQN